MRNSIVVGVDIGGSHITVALIDMDKGEVLNHTWKRLNVDAQSSAQTIIDVWVDAIEESIKAHNIMPFGLGIAMPGPFDYDQGISLMQNQNKYDALYGLNIKQLLGQRLKLDKHHIVLTNDAACFLKGETFSGVAKGYNKVLGLTLGTGLGSARAINSEVEDANLWCAPFKEGIAEDYLSSRWFVSRYFELTGEKIRDVKEMVGRLHKRPQVQQLFNEFGNNLAAFLVPFIRNEGVEIIVLGGNISNAYDLFASSFGNEMQEQAFHVKLKRSLLNENATLVGAASYCLKKESLALADLNNS